MFEKIKNINIENPDTWQNYVFLTFDIDWASDDVLNYAIDIIEEAGICATWFATHKTPVLERLMANPHFELGIHPNFNFLLQGDVRNGRTAEEVIDRLLEIVPEAKTVRSHSLTQSSQLLNLFQQKGLSHECNDYISYESGINTKPWKTWNGMIKCPHLWEDDLALITKNPIKDTFNSKCLKIYAFHPLHIFLNTESMERYKKAKPYQDNFNKLKRFINTQSKGTKVFLLDLIRNK